MNGSALMRSVRLAARQGAFCIRGQNLFDLVARHGQYALIAHQSIQRFRFRFVQGLRFVLCRLRLRLWRMSASRRFLQAQYIGLKGGGGFSCSASAASFVERSVLASSC